MADSRLRPLSCGIDARPRASEHRILLEQPGDHCGVEIGAGVYDHVVAEIDDPAITVVEPHAVLGSSARVEFDYGLIVLDDEILDAELRRRTESCAGCWSPLLCFSCPGPIRARRRSRSERSANPLRQSASRIRSLHRQRAARASIADRDRRPHPARREYFCGGSTRCAEARQFRRAKASRSRLDTAAAGTGDKCVDQ